jgi:hypothetical protein
MVVDLHLPMQSVAITTIESHPGEIQSCYLILPDSSSNTNGIWFMVFNTTFNNISAISRRQVLLVEETGLPRENHRPVEGH